MGWDFTKGYTHDVSDPMVRAFQNAGYHAAQVMDTPCPVDEFGQAYDAHMTVGILAESYKIRITPTGRNMGSVWDTVFITTPDGKEHSCGNRCGGRDTLMALYAEEFIKAVTGTGKPYEPSGNADKILNLN